MISDSACKQACLPVSRLHAVPTKVRDTISVRVPWPNLPNSAQFCRHGRINFR